MLEVPTVPKPSARRLRPSTVGGTLMAQVRDLGRAMRCPPELTGARLLQEKAFATCGKSAGTTGGAGSSRLRARLR